MQGSAYLGWHAPRQPHDVQLLLKVWIVAPVVLARNSVEHSPLGPAQVNDGWHMQFPSIPTSELACGHGSELRRA